MSQGYKNREHSSLDCALNGSNSDREFRASVIIKRVEIRSIIASTSTCELYYLTDVLSAVSRHDLRRTTSPRCRLPSVYRVAQKLAQFLYALTLPNINRFPKLFHCQNQEKICNNTITKNPTTPQVCRYTILWIVKCLKATIQNKTTSVTTNFKKLTTGSNVFIVSVIV